ncbi:MAG: transposase [Deltaproteobacteria bacterium]|nr:transposase [Deltaproteobacteria bacterium]
MNDPKRVPPTRARVRKHLSADALLRTVGGCFNKVADHRTDDADISLHDALMSGYAVFSLKAPSLLAFDKQRQEEENNLRSIFHIRRIPCDTQMRTVLDGVNPEQLRRSYKAVFSRLQRGKALEEMEYLNGYYLMLLDGTEYFSSEKLHSPFCMERINSETGKTTYYLQTVGAALAHPDRKEVIPLMPEPISKQDGQTKNDCELNASRRFISKFRKDHPHLKVIVCQDAISPNGPYIRFLKEHNCRFILSVKESDHAYLFKQLDAAIESADARDHAIVDTKDPDKTHGFRWVNGLSINASHKDVRVNLLEYWELRGEGKKYFSWVTDFIVAPENVYQIMRGGRARWKIENETFNTLKNQGYNFEHNYGLGAKYLSMVFVTLMMLAFLVDQTQQLSCTLFQSVWKKVGSKKALWEKIRALFNCFLFDSMEMLYLAILHGYQKDRPRILWDDS